MKLLVLALIFCGKFSIILEIEFFLKIIQTDYGRH